MSSVFISYSRQDYEFVRRLIADLQAEGIQVWIDQQGLQVGTPSWERAIRDAIRAADAVVLIASTDSGQSRYVRGELHIAEMYKRPVYPVWAAGEMWAECVPLGLIEMQHTDARGNKYGKALLDLLTALRNVGSVDDEKQATESAAVDPDFVPRNPYKGLRAFTGNDTGDFFGRDGLVKELVEAVGAASKLSVSRFLAIVGPSGSGKSSVVMAGLLPKLQSGALPGSKEWVYLDPVLPGSQPLESLAVILADALHMATVDVLKDLDASARGLHLLGRRLTKGRGDARVVLLVDQFEELFTQTMDADKRDHFIDLLVTAAQERDGQLLVILTLRADFYDRPMNYAPLGKLLEKHTKSVLPMSIEDLRDVIEKPAVLTDVKLEFEPGLVGDLLFEVRGQTGALPLLQFTLDQLAERRQGRKLTNAAYQDMGGVKGALAKHAESVYQSLPTDQHRELTRSLFLRLIEPGATEQDTTRRRAAQSELVTPDPQQTELLREVSAAFVNARLLTTNVIAGLAVIEVSHEALIREWEQLANWLNTARTDVHLQQMISRDTAEWIQRGKQEDDLYRGGKLEEAAKWKERSAASSDEVEFIQAGLSFEVAQRLITETTKRFQLIFSEIPVLFQCYDDQGNCVIWNKECERVTGYSTEEICYNPNHLELLYPDPNHRQHVINQQQVSHGDFRDWELETTCKDKSTRYILWSNVSKAYPIPGWDDWAIGVDVTERRLIEDALRQSEANFSVALKNSPIFVSRVDADLRYIWVYNPPAGFTPGDMIGKRDEEIWTYDLMKNLIAFKKEVLETNKGARREIKFDAGTEYMIYDVTAEPVFDDDRAIGLTMAMLDITEIKKAELRQAELAEQERIAREKAEAADRLKIEFLAMISHELRVPMTTIKGFATTLLADDITWDMVSQQEFLSIISEETDRLVDFIEELNDLSLFETGIITIQLSSLQLSECLPPIIPQLQMLTPKHQLNIDIPNGLPLVLADSRRIGQVLINLVDNAAKYAPPNTVITITAHQSNNAVQVMVIDEGPGIPLDKRKIVFEAFRELDSKFDNHIKGVGIGLAICRRFVEAQGGQIWVMDSDKSGTTIAFTIPIAKD